MARKKQSDEAADTADSAVQGISLVTDGEGRVKIPDPVVPKTDEPEAVTEKEKPKAESLVPDVNVPVGHLVSELARNAGAVRLNRLAVLARNNRDVRWLLEQYTELNSLLNTNTK